MTEAVSYDALPELLEGGIPATPGPGECWTVSLVRARLVDAMDTLKRLKFPENGAPPRMRTAMPLPPADWSAYGWETAPTPRPSPPTPAAITRLDQTLPWLIWIGQPKHRKVVCLRAVGLSWRRVAGAVGLGSPDTARQWEAAALDVVVAKLNQGTS